MKRHKTWLGIGVSVLAGTSATLAATPGPIVRAVSSAPPTPMFFESGKAEAPRIVLAQAGGGEGGKTIVPQSYVLPDVPANYDATSEVAAYAKGVHASYVAATAEANKMQAAIEAMLAKPSAATLAAARAAWTAARPSYLVTEAFRFYDGPVEAVELELNSWPINEAFIDYVKGAPQSGIINDPKVEMSLVAIMMRNQVSDEADVTLGWHAIEFLLWGQDFSATGPGARPFSDYTQGQGNNDRRATYLRAITARLLADLGRLELAWRPGIAGNYAAQFAAMDPRQAVGRIVSGIAVLTGSELMSQRLAVGLDSGDQEDEHSCFSDTTWQDFNYDLKGVDNVWTGRYPGVAGAGVRDLVRRVDPVVAAEVDRRLAEATASIAALPRPWDQVLASASGSAGRVKAEAAVSALGALAQGLKRAGTRLGVIVQIP